MRVSHSSDNQTIIKNDVSEFGCIVFVKRLSISRLQNTSYSLAERPFALSDVSTPGHGQGEGPTKWEGPKERSD